MKAFKFFPVVAFILIATFQLSAQGTLRGKLIDATNGEPIMFGNVLVPALGTGTTTDLDGAYELELAAGTYEIRFTYLGYSDLTISDVVIKEGEVSLLDGNLAEESELIEEIVVTASQARNTETALATIRRKSVNV